MSPTIGKTWPYRTTNGDRVALCDICGVPWRRGQLRRDGAGHLRCPDDRKGLDAVTLSRLNAEMAGRRQPGGYIDGASGFNMQGQDYAQGSPALPPGPEDVILSAQVITYNRSRMEIGSDGGTQVMTRWFPDAGNETARRGTAAPRARLIQQAVNGRPAIRIVPGQRIFSIADGAAGSFGPYSAPSFFWMVLRQIEWKEGAALMSGNNILEMALIQSGALGDIALANTGIGNKVNVPLGDWVAVAMQFRPFGEVDTLRTTKGTVTSPSGTGVRNQTFMNVNLLSTFDVAEFGCWLGEVDEEEVDELFDSFVPAYYGLVEP